MDLTALSPLLPGPVGVGSQTDTSDTDANAAAADFDTFLTLMTAQLRNQDPLSPLEATEFVAQLASFSSVEQLVSANAKLSTLSDQALTSDIASFASWIGREVAVADGTFRATGDPVDFAFAPPGIDEQIRATVRTSSGTALTQFLVDPNTGTGVWDGKDSSGALVHGTELTIDLDYIAGGATERTVPAEVMRRVSGLHGSANGMVLDLADGGSVSPDAVVHVSEADPTP
ncbi:MAG: flagellar hook capping FlgD N-terminal domain-containing protein [Pseudomonadota bacterium]